MGFKMALTSTQKKTLDKAYPNIQKIVELSRLSGAEITMTVMGSKPAMADAILLDKRLNDNLKKIADCAKAIGLCLATSKYKYIVNSPQGIFKEIAISDPRSGKIILALAPTKDKARKGADYYHAKMIDGKFGYKFGKLMGYPECCLQFGNYLQNLQGDVDNFGFKNPAIESLKRSKHFDWHLNVFTVSLLPHYPCSFTCSKSIDYVKHVLLYMDYVDKGQSSFLRDYLQNPISLYWTCADRILLYGKLKRTGLMTGEVEYTKIEPMLTSNTFYQEVDRNKLTEWHKIEKALKEGNRLVVTDKKCTVYKGRECLLNINKNNKYVPVLVKPDR
jgi:hypothetical protein